MINLIFFLPTFDYGGAGNSVYRLCKNLNHKKYKINIISIGKCYYKKQFNKFCENVYELDTKRTFFLHIFCKSNFALLEFATIASAFL